MKKKNTIENLKEWQKGPFYISYNLNVYHNDKLIGKVNVAESTDPEAENEIVCFTPEGIELANSAARSPEHAFLKLMSLK